MQKPIVKITGAFIIGNRLFGVVHDYPESHHAYSGCVTNGREVTTSPIVSINKTLDGDVVETQRTLYRVTWAEQGFVPTYTKSE